MASAIVAPQLSIFQIECGLYPGYNLAHLGKQVLLMKANKDDPKQLWYRDDSWRFIDENSFVLLNMATKKALKCPPVPSKQSLKATMVDYDPSVTDKSLLWAPTSDCGLANKLTSGDALQSSELGVSFHQSHGKPDGVSVIVGTSISTPWKFIPYDPPSFRIQCTWVNQVLTYKPPYETVKYVGMPKEQTDENNVVGISPNESSADVRARQIWYRIPSGGQEDTNNYTSFILVNKTTGLTLKGSSKPAEKVLAVEYDPLDYDFVWAEDRTEAPLQRDYVYINLSKLGSTKLFWGLPNNLAYQNVEWYHPLTVTETTQKWKFTQASN